MTTVAKKKARTLEDAERDLADERESHRSTKTILGAALKEMAAFRALLAAGCQSQVSDAVARYFAANPAFACQIDYDYAGIALTKYSFPARTIVIAAEHAELKPPTLDPRP